jgi:N6-adenosine-specific RNA methylase IME4
MFSGLPTGSFRVVYADPPWSFKRWSDIGKGRSAEKHYPAMPLDNIKAMSVADLAAKDCALLMWATFPRLPDAIDVIEAWGFKYSTSAVGVKPTARGGLWDAATGGAEMQNYACSPLAEGRNGSTKASST